MTPIHFLKEQFMISLLLKVSFCLSSEKSNKQGGRHFKGNSGCPKERYRDQAPFFKNTRKILINEYPRSNIICIVNFFVPFVYTELSQKGDFWSEFPKLDYGSQSPRYGKTFNFIVPTEYIEKIHQSLLLIC